VHRHPPSNLKGSADILSQNEIDELFKMSEETLSKMICKTIPEVNSSQHSIRHTELHMLCDIRDCPFSDNWIDSDYTIFINYEADTLPLGKLPDEIISALRPLG